MRSSLIPALLLSLWSLPAAAQCVNGVCTLPGAAGAPASSGGSTFGSPSLGGTSGEGICSGGSCSANAGFQGEGGCPGGSCFAASGGGGGGGGERQNVLFLMLRKIFEGGPARSSGGGCSGTNCLRASGDGQEPAQTQIVARARDQAKAGAAVPMETAAGPATPMLQERISAP